MDDFKSFLKPVNYYPFLGHVPTERKYLAHIFIETAWDTDSDIQAVDQHGYSLRYVVLDRTAIKKRSGVETPCAEEIRHSTDWPFNEHSCETIVPQLQ